MLKDYILQSWVLILILAAFAISLSRTIFLDKKTVKRMYVLILIVFILSIDVFLEFYFARIARFHLARSIMMAIRYSSTPFIIAQVVYTLIKKMRWLIFIPAIVLAAVDAVSIFTGIVFRVNDDGSFTRGPLGMLPFIVAGAYCVFLIYILLLNSNKQSTEIIPIVFLSFSLGSDLVLPFIFGSAFATIFCTTIAIALYVYYVFLILQLTKIDALTGLLNRQAFYSDIEKNSEYITAMLSIDMNGLKALNDNEGHAAGDEAISTIALCFKYCLKRRQSAYRIGGDEFIILCQKTSWNDVVQLVERIQRKVAETKYTCSIGLSYSEPGKKTIDELQQESDKMMYEDKARYYMASGRDRRRR